MRRFTLHWLILDWRGAVRLRSALESKVTSLAESSATEKEEDVSRDNDAYRLAQDERHAQGDKDVMKGHIETLMRVRNRQRLHISSVVGELTSNSQAPANDANTLLYVDIY